MSDMNVMLIIDTDNSIKKQIYASKEDIYDVLETDDIRPFKKSLSEHYNLAFIVAPASNDIINAAASVMLGENVYGPAVVMGVDERAKLSPISFGEGLGISSILDGIIYEKNKQIEAVYDEYKQNLYDEVVR